MKKGFVVDFNGSNVYGQGFIFFYCVKNCVYECYGYIKVFFEECCYCCCECLWGKLVEFFLIFCIVIIGNFMKKFKYKFDNLFDCQRK